MWWWLRAVLVHFSWRGQCLYSPVDVVVGGCLACNRNNFSSVFLTLDAMVSIVEWSLSSLFRTLFNCSDLCRKRGSAFFWNVCVSKTLFTFDSKFVNRSIRIF